MVDSENSQREICVAIDPRAIRRHGVEAAVVLAEGLNARVRGLVIANNLLQQASRLPFVTEIVVATGEERAFSHEGSDAEQARNLALLRKIIDQYAVPRRVKFLLETLSGDISLSALLSEQQDLYLPAGRKGLAHTGSRPGAVRSVKWVYDGSAATGRCLSLLEELIGRGFVKRVLLLARCPVPRQVLADLSKRGAQVYWMHTDHAQSLLQQLKGGAEADLILVPASYSAALGEQALADLNAVSSAPILVVG